MPGTVARGPPPILVRSAIDVLGIRPHTIMAKTRDGGPKFGHGSRPGKRWAGDGHGVLPSFQTCGLRGSRTWKDPSMRRMMRGRPKVSRTSTHDDPAYFGGATTMERRIFRSVPYRRQRHGHLGAEMTGIARNVFAASFMPDRRIRSARERLRSAIEYREPLADIPGRVSNAFAATCASRQRAYSALMQQTSYPPHDLERGAGSVVVCASGDRHRRSSRQRSGSPFQKLDEKLAKQTAIRRRRSAGTSRGDLALLDTGLDAEQVHALSTWGPCRRQYRSGKGLRWLSSLSFATDECAPIARPSNEKSETAQSRRLSYAEEEAGRGAGAGWYRVATLRPTSVFPEAVAPALPLPLSD